MLLRVAALTDVGKQRQENEDSYAAVQQDERRWLLLVCDGMGGYEGGRLASVTARDSIATALSAADHASPAAIFDALKDANQAVLDTTAAADVPQAGSTAVVAWVLGDRYWMGWVGDSRLYHFRGESLVERSRDHTRVAAMVERNILSESEARGHPEAHVLTSALGGGHDGGELHVSVYNEPVELEVGDVLVLCSDGLHDLVEEHEIPALVANNAPEQAVSRLVALANERGGHDNITVILAVCERDTPATVESVSRPERKNAATPAGPRPSLQALVPAFVLGLLIGLIIGVLAGSLVFR